MAFCMKEIIISQVDIMALVQKLYLNLNRIQHITVIENDNVQLLWVLKLHLDVVTVEEEALEESNINCMLFEWNRFLYNICRHHVMELVVKIFLTLDPPIVSGSHIQAIPMGIHKQEIKQNRNRGSGYTWGFGWGKSSDSNWVQEVPDTGKPEITLVNLSNSSHFLEISLNQSIQLIAPKLICHSLNKQYIYIYSLKAWACLRQWKVVPLFIKVPILNVIVEIEQKGAL